MVFCMVKLARAMVVLSTKNNEVTGIVPMLLQQKDFFSREDVLLT